MVPIKNGNNSVIIWGRVSSNEATYREFESGKRVSNFSVQYDSVPGEDGGKRKGVYVDCSAWGEIADFARNLERGDNVLCCGRLDLDKYASGKKGEDVYRLTCEFISAMGE